MRAPRKIKPENLKRLCWQRGISITELAAKIGRSRMNVYRAVANPKGFKPTFRKIEEVLCA